ncbi:MAG: aminotransferase class I/II-fold pyridoxal phosphate-dependent enzyme [Candidatus Mycalebacterium zealandia]|nr:MAG: aminotransferase class I/II-fold pyridoxal phosphate-dependent enzyme [Candidatus Mycalebacterium zealandia]
MASSGEIVLSRLAEGLEPFYVMETLETAARMEKEGIDVIHFEVGHPDLPTAPEVCEAAIEAVKRGETAYAPSTGIDSLKERIAQAHCSRYGLNVTASNVLVTSGSSPALLIAVLCVVNPGDEVVITDPHYACYPGMIKSAGGVPVTVPVYAEEKYQIDMARLKKVLSPRTKAIIINSPSNPTGAIQIEETLAEISSLGIFVISDEIYHGLEYGVKSKSVLNHTNRAVAVNGFSKLCSMTGWRLGYMIAPEPFIRAAQKFQQNLFLCANPFVQRGGEAAVEYVFPQADEIAAIYMKRRDAMIKELSKAGISPCGDPRGAFYVFVKIPGKNTDSRRVASNILEKTHVAVTPGFDFGREGEGHLRFSYATGIDKINEGITRIVDYLQKTL